jgi:hypothetical protein
VINGVVAGALSVPVPDDESAPPSHGIRALSGAAKTQAALGVAIAGEQGSNGGGAERDHERGTDGLAGLIVLAAPCQLQRLEPGRRVVVAGGGSLRAGRGGCGW